VIIDQAAALEWIDQLRVTIPEDIKSARRVTNEVERLLEQAREEAEQILVLVGLETEVMRTLKTIKRGLELLDDRRVVASSAAAAAAATEAMGNDAQGDTDEYYESDPEEPVRG
jgi:vacuolar-type H+-ATPase subunit E/Vma4